VGRVNSDQLLPRPCAVMIILLSGD
jgi:hypothetical protein